MDKKKIDLNRRRYLTIAASIMGGIGVSFSSIPFIISWLPSAKAKALGAPIEIDISNIEEGQKITLDWRGQPIFVIKRNNDTIKNLNTLKNKLRDPDSKEEQQPRYTKNDYRSIRPEIFVVIGICTHLGCVPLYKPKIGEIDSTWMGGFFCPCHGSRFDLAGRVFKGVPAPCNLVIPPHKYINEKILKVGED